MALGAILCIFATILLVHCDSVIADIGIAPIISPNKPELILNEGEPLKITCVHSEHMFFRYPEENEIQNIHVSDVLQEELINDSKFVYNFERPHTVHGDTGWYGCANYNEEDFSPKYPSNNGKWIYVYVKSNETLFVQKTNPDDVSPILLTGVVSKDITIPCRPSSPDYKVDLFDDSENEVYVDNRKVYFDPRFGFEIKNLTILDSNGYSCVIDEIIMREEIKYHLYVSRKFYLPTPVVAKESVEHVIEGDTLHVNCSLITEPDVLFLLNWTIPNESRKVQNKFHYHQLHPNKRETTIELIVQDITVKDEGTYTCHAKNQYDHKFRDIFVKIYDPNTTFLRLIPEYNDTHYIVREGQTVVWTVHIEAHPLPNITWFNSRGEEMKDFSYDTADAKYVIENSVNKLSLTIKRLNLNDAGIYSLQATNGRLMEFLNYTLDVVAKPIAYIEDVHPYYILNKKVQFICSIAAYPLPNINWTYLSCPNYPSDIDCTLTDLHNIDTTASYIKFKSTVTHTIDESGILSCVACNEVGCDISKEPVLVTEFTDGFGIKPSLETVVEGDDLVIDCGVSIYNYTNNITLYDSRSEIHETDRLLIKSKMTPFSFVKTIEFHDVQLTDSGILTCRSVTKDHLLEELQYNLQVFKAVPVSIMHTNMNGTDETVDLNKLSTNEQQTLIFNCFMEGLPFPNITWYKDNVLIKKSEQFEISNHNQELRIKYLHEKDSGLYKCEGINRLNKKTLYKNLTVLGKNVSLTWIIAVVVLMILCIVLFVYFSIKVHREKVLRKQLTEAGLMHFEDGALECLNPALTVDDQAELLPYDKTYEFPRQNLKLGKQLGSGAFGVVLKAEAKDILENEETTTVAVKMVRRSADPTNIRALASELKILIHLGRHLNVVNLLGACTENILKCELLVIVEYCRYGNLHNYLLRNREHFINQINPKTGKLDVSINNFTSDDSSMSFNSTVDTEAPLFSSKLERDRAMFNTLQSNSSYEPGWGFNYRGDYNDHNIKPICTQDLLSWAFQVARGMEYLSKRKVLHGDLAARNILLAERNVVKICDFGLAKTMYKNDNYKKKGDELLPVKWLAIESIRDRIFSTQSDVWSYGIVLWELFTLAKTPYPGMEAEKIYTKLIEGYRMEKPEFATKEIYNVMLSCWKAKPTLRPSFDFLVGSIGDLLEDNIKEYYIDLNTSYTNMNNTNLDGKDDYLEMLSAPDYTLLSSPVQMYVNTPILNAENQNHLKHKLRDKPTARDPAEEALLEKNSSSDRKRSNSAESHEICSTMNDEDEDNYLKPIDIHEKRAVFIRQKQLKRDLKDDQSNNYCNTSINKNQLGCAENANYLNMPIQGDAKDTKNNIPDSFSNPTYVLMDTVKNESE